MTKPKTTFAGGKSPWPQVVVDVSTLVIEDHPPPGKRINPPNKYEAIFAKLAPGKGNIRCKPEETSTISNALRNWVKEKKIAGKVRASPNGIDPKTKETVGRVWILKLDEKK